MNSNRVENHGFRDVSCYNTASGGLCPPAGERTMKKNLFVALIFATVASSHANLIINGSFEINSATGTLYNLSNAGFNSLMSNATSYGDPAELDIITFGGIGLAPQNGSWKVGLANGQGLDAMTLELSSNMIAGRSYDLTFWAYRDASFTSGTNSLKIGVSNSPTDSGIAVYNTGTGLSTSQWNKFTTTFVAPLTGGRLSVYNDVQAGSPTTWIHADNFTLVEAVPEPATMTALGLGLALAARRRRK